MTHPIKNARNFEVAWRPEPGVNYPHLSKGWDGLTMTIDARPANESRGGCLTETGSFARQALARQILRRRHRRDVEDATAYDEWRENVDRELSDPCVRGSFVYFAGKVDRGLIKIGYAKDIPNRLRKLRRQARAQLVMLATVPGGRNLECLYHHMFAAERVGLEWFRRSPLLTAEIARLVGGPRG